MMVGKTSIEHILHSHYRAITDINWHTSEPDTVASVGIDAWVWSWDLREPRKPVLGASFDHHLHHVEVESPQVYVHSTVSVSGTVHAPCDMMFWAAGGTQVKWNRQDPNVLASSHMNEVLIWDRRVCRLHYPS